MPVEQIRERPLALVRVEAVVLLHRHPRQIPPSLRDLVAEPCVLLLALEQLLPAASHSSRVPILWSAMVLSFLG